MRSFRSFSYRQAHYRISSCGFDAAAEEIIAVRKELERFIMKNPVFRDSMSPLDLLPEDAPEPAKRLNDAGRAVGVGPMAAVAGYFAQRAAEKALASGCGEAVVENGGDVYLCLEDELILGTYTGRTPLGKNIAFRILPEDSPLAVCSSSSLMGHSASFGRCDLATVFSSSGALADAAATLACNLVKTEKDIASAVERILEIEGIRGILIVKNDKVGIGGDIPEIVRNSDPGTERKITRDINSNFRQK